MSGWRRLLAADWFAMRGPDQTVVTTSADFGVTPGLQLGVTVPAGVVGSSHSALAQGEIMARAKIALTDWLVFEPSVTVPSGSAIRQDAGAYLPLYAGLSRGAWSLYGGAGYAFASARDGGDIVFAGLVVSRAVSPRVTVGAEIAGHTGNGLMPPFLEAGPGIAVALDDRFTLALSAYRTLAHSGSHGDGRAMLTLRYAR